MRSHDQAFAFHPVAIYCSILIALFLLLASNGVTHAQTGGIIGTCMGPQNCSANDGGFSGFDVISGPDSCLEGEPVTFQLRARLNTAQPTRYDIGIWVALNGLTPRQEPSTGNNCYRDILSPLAPGTPLNLTGGYGGFRNIDGDACGDAASGDQNFKVLSPMTITCSDTSTDGRLDVGACISYVQNQQSACNSANDIAPGTGSKCECGAVPIGQVDVRRPAYLEVRKVVEPSAAPGLVALSIVGTDAFTTFQHLSNNVGNLGSTGRLTVTAGSRLQPNGAYTITESAENGTDLADFDTTVRCVQRNNNNTVAGPVAATSLNLTVQPGDDIVCTFTNRYNKGTLQIVKNVVPDDPTSSWLLDAVGPTAFAATVAGDGQTAVTTVFTGTYTISESGVNGTSLDDYAPAYACTRDGEATSVIGDGSTFTLNVEANRSYVCTFTNTRRTGTVIIRKQASGGNDSFAFTASSALASPFTISTTDGSGAIQFDNVPTGSHSVTEGLLADGWYFDGLSCVESGGVNNLPTTVNGQTALIGLDDGETVDCTFRNVRYGALDVTKIVNWNGLPPIPNQTYTICVAGVDFAENCRVFTGNETQTWNSLRPGSYAVSEQSPVESDGWSIEISDATVEVRAGETATSTVSNMRRLYTLLVEKTASAAFTREYTWELTKTVAPEQVEIFDGAQATVTYTVTATRDAGEDSAFAIWGTATISNPMSEIVYIATVADSLSNGDTVTLSCPADPPGSNIALAAGQQIECTYNQPVGDVAAGDVITNLLEVTLTNGQVFTFTASATFGNPTDEISDTITVVDDNGLRWTTDQTTSWTYPQTFTCADVRVDWAANPYAASFTHTNTALIEGVPGAETTVDLPVNCYRLEVSKHADTALTRTYTWEIGKVVAPAVLNLNEADSGSFDYTITVTRTGYTDSNWAVTGLITVTNRAPMTAALTSLIDELPGSAQVVLAGDGCADNIEVRPNDSLVCAYTATGLASGATVTNTAIALLADTQYTGTATVDFSAPVTITEVYTQVNVSDIMRDTRTNADTIRGPFGPLNTGDEVTYMQPADCASVIYDANAQGGYTFDNTATIAETGVFAQATAEVICTGNAQISIVKRTVGGDGAFDFVSEELGSFTLTTENGERALSFASLLSGSYAVTESTPAGWTLTAATCSDGGSPDNIALGAGADVTCTFTNTLGLARIRFDEPTATNAVNAPHNFTVTVETSIDNGASWQPVTGQLVTGTVAGTVTGVGSLVNQTCTTNSDGNCVLTVDSATAGETNLAAEALVDVLGLETLVSTYGETGDSRNAVKTWVDLRVRIDPQTDANPLNAPHTFTISVTQNLGDGVWAPVEDGVAATVTIDPPGFTQTSDSCADPGTVDGECTVVINSSVTQQYTANATVTASVAGQSITRSTADDPANIAAGGSGPAIKRYVEGDIVITKSVATFYTRTFGWTIDKIALPETLDIFDGDSETVGYTIVVTKDVGVDSDFAIAGSVTFENISQDNPVILHAPVDTLTDGTPIALTCGVAFPYALAPSETLSCTYNQALESALDTTNWVTVTTTSGSMFTTTAEVSFGAPTVLVNDSIEVTDTNTTTVWSTSGITDTFVYGQRLSCADVASSQYVNGVATYRLDNTAQIVYEEGEGPASTATITVNCYRLLVSKDAGATFTRQYLWDIQKMVNPNAWDLFVGDQATSTYTVTTTIIGQQDSDWTVSGAITISNPAPMPANVTSVVDVLPNGQPAAVSCASGVSVPANSSATCTYNAQLGGVVSGDNTVTATVQTDAGDIAYVGAAPVIFGSPTTEIDKTVTVSDDLLGGSLGEFGDGQAKSYAIEFQSCSEVTFPEGENSRTFVIDNTATIDDTAIADSAQVTVTCWKPPVIKTAGTRYDRIYDYDIVKTAEPAEQTIYYTDTATFAYTVQVTKFIKEENGFAVGGMIEISNPAPIDATLASIEELLPDAADMTVICAPDDAAPYTLPAGGELVCTYSAGLPDKGFRINTVRVTMSNGTVISTTADVDFSQAEVTPINDSANITDTFFGDVWTVFTSTQTIYNKTFTCEEAVYDETTGLYRREISNVASVLLPDGASDSAMVALNCYQLSLSVQKTAAPPSLPEPGGVFTFAVLVVNDSPTPVRLTTLSDDIYGDLTQVTGRMTGTTCALPQEPLPANGGQYACNFMAVVTGAPGFTETDTVTASGVDSAGMAVMASDSATVAITNLPSSITLTKTASQSVLPWPGGDVTFTIAVQNTSIADTVRIDTLTDSIYGDITQTGDAQTGDTVLATTCAVPQVLLPGATYTCDFTVNLTLPADAAEDLVETNIATAEGIDDDGQPVQASDDATVTVSVAQFGVIGNRVFVDIDPAGLSSAARLAGNQQQDYDENGQPIEDNVPDIDLLLFTADNRLVAQTISDENGEYNFVNVPPGDYYVVFVNNDIFMGPWAGYNSSIADAINSDVDPSMPLDAAVEAIIDDLLGEGASLDAARTPTFSLAPNQHYLDLDAGLIDLSGASSVDINGIIWLDANRDGIRQPEETARIADVLVELFRVSGSQPDQVTKMDQRTTGSNGHFEFLGLDAGAYFVRMTFYNLRISPPHVGDDDTIDSDINPASGESDLAILTLETISIDAGVYSMPTALEPVDEPAMLGYWVFLPAVQR